MEFPPCRPRYSRLRVCGGAIGSDPVPRVAPPNFSTHMLISSSLWDLLPPFLAFRRGFPLEVSFAPWGYSPEFLRCIGVRYTRVY